MKKRSGYGALAVAGLLTLVIAPMVLAQIPKGSKRSQFMRQKLEFSKQVLEGLAVEDFPLIEKGARALKTLSQAAEWEDPMIPNVEQYIPNTREFQRLTEELARKARAKNIDGSTLAFMQLTMNCVTCHKFVREAK